MLAMGWRGWFDWTCFNPPETVLQCACEKEGLVYLKLRGRCPGSLIDTYWTPQNEGGQYFLHGIKTSEIKYNKESSTWQLKAIGENQISVASSDSPSHSFLLGKSNWYINNDKSRIFLSTNLH